VVLQDSGREEQPNSNLILYSPNQEEEPADLESSHMDVNAPVSAPDYDEEIKNELGAVEDPVIREMLEEWDITSRQQCEREDNRAVTVHGKRNHKTKKPNNPKSPESDGP
jgi:hypothetical protein